MRSWLALTLAGLRRDQRGRRGAVLPERGDLPRGGEAQPRLVRGRDCQRRPARGLVSRERRTDGRRRRDPGGLAQGGQRRWEPRFILADTPGYPDCNPALFAAPDRTLWLFWPTILDHRWEGALLKFAVASDDGPALGPPAWKREGVLHVTPDGFGRGDGAGDRGDPGPARREPSKNALDRLAEPVQGRALPAPRLDAARPPDRAPLGPMAPAPSTPTRSPPRSSRSATTGATSWSASEPMIGFGNIQPSLVRKADGTIVAFMRDNGPHRKIRLSTRRTKAGRGAPVTDSALPNPGAGIEAIRLANGHWALVYNDAAKGRHSLALSISDDEGTTWQMDPPRRAASSRATGPFHYPSLIQARDGTIHVTYTRRVDAEGQHDPARRLQRGVGGRGGRCPGPMTSRTRRPPPSIHGDNPVTTRPSRRAHRGSGGGCGTWPGRRR